MHVEIGPNCSCSSFALNVYLFDISCKQEKRNQEDLDVSMLKHLEWLRMDFYGKTIS